MLKKRIIPCLDIRDGRTVKGINFVNIRDAGDPVELAERYVREGADELVFLDISATNEKRATIVSLVQKVAQKIDIPFTVGGGINSLKAASDVILAGADKVSLNSAAVKQPDLIQELANNYGTQCVVLAMDVKKVNGKWKVFTHGGKVETEWEAMTWAKQTEALGAGEILLTSMDNDGTKNGFQIEITKNIAAALKIPVIASGGAGSIMHFEEVFTQTKATGALAAGIFHYGEVRISDLKQALKNKQIVVR
ncbi:MAG TPA: imidazole glycerol phosphate synthase subunit HisF [Ginsengibacter sp.]|nr:imidazole glycerol phosphate synthase subunit HisF [Ginsengibacter sp.]HRP16960.1 imidazole glycerol phosphate synthase subunit HisF [Ginsengibacter sp.]HRP43791.1 imidazole glycerol phosphate synthase subunit HisF [Ginsengibacter sp.]